jgi:hypothetical protein
MPIAAARIARCPISIAEFTAGLCASSKARYSATECQSPGYCCSSQSDGMT